MMRSALRGSGYGLRGARFALHVKRISYKCHYSSTAQPATRNPHNFELSFNRMSIENEFKAAKVRI